MFIQTVRNFLAPLRQKLFIQAVDREIYSRIFPHLEREKHAGYTFDTDDQLLTLTAQLDIRDLLAEIDRQMTRMPKAYGESFRYILYRDLHHRLRMYEKAARRHVRPDWCDPRKIATCA